MSVPSVPQAVELEKSIGLRTYRIRLVSPSSIPTAYKVIPAAGLILVSLAAPVSGISDAIGVATSYEQPPCRDLRMVEVTAPGNVPTSPKRRSGPSSPNT